MYYSFMSNDKTFFYCGQSLKSWHLFLNTLALRKPMRNATAMQIRELASRWHAIGDSSFIRMLVRCDFVKKKCLSLFNLWDFRYVYLTNARFLEFKKIHNAIFKSFYCINMAPENLLIDFKNCTRETMHYVYSSFL